MNKSYIVYRKLKGSEIVDVDDLIIVKQPQEGIIIKADSDLSKDVVGVPANWLIAPEDDHVQDKKAFIDSVLWGLIHIMIFIISFYLLNLIDNKIPSGFLILISTMASIEIGRSLGRLCE